MYSLGCTLPYYCYIHSHTGKSMKAVGVNEYLKNESEGCEEMQKEDMAIEEGLLQLPLLLQQVHYYLSPPLRFQKKTDQQYTTVLEMGKAEDMLSLKPELEAVGDEDSGSELQSRWATVRWVQ